MNCLQIYFNIKESKVGKEIIKLLLASIFMLYPLSIAGQTVFRYVQDGKYYSEGVDGIVTSDSCFVAAGNADKFIRTDTIVLDCEDCKIPYDTIFRDIITSDIQIIKTMANGNILWTKRIGDEGNDRCFSIYETIDKGYLICATDSGNNGNVIKLNHSGNFLWKNSLNFHTPLKVFEVNGNYLVMGTKSYIINGSSGIYAQLLDQAGNQLWLKYYSKTGSDPILTGIYQETFKTACQGTNNDVFIVGSNMNNIIWYDIDYQGILLSQGRINDSNIENAVNVSLTSDFNYILLSNSSGIPVSFVQPAIMKLNPLGEVLWKKTYFDQTYYDKGTIIKKGYEDGFIIAGMKNSNVPELSSSFIFKTDENGIPRWIDNNSFDNENYICNVSATMISDNEIFEVGTSKEGKFTFDRRKVSTTDGNVEYNTGTKNILSEKVNYNLYPNPAHSFITINLKGCEDGEFKLYDLSGRQMLNFNLISSNTKVPLNSLNNGIYIFKLITSEGTYTGKLMINGN